ncbi:MAG: DUF6089 family protein [Bacteroidales bacterium]|jgi:opacity protein-like surface antigen|nr:DUF6089 family protein [Bacteroidales bacterium]
MRINISIVVILLFFSYSVEAQYRRYKTYEVHFGLGVSHVLGDIGGSSYLDNWAGIRDLTLRHSRPMLYLGGRNDFNEHFSGKVNLFAGMTSDDDRGSLRDERGFAFNTFMLELSGQVEWNFLRIRGSIGSLLAKRKGLRSYRMTTRPYIFAGIGFCYNYIDFNTRETIPCSGEYFKKSVTALVFPLGIGIRTDVSEGWSLGLEIGGRFTNSDYIDGFTTDWSKSNDAYYFTTIHAIYKIQFVGGKKKTSRRR